MKCAEVVMESAEQNRSPRVCNCLYNYYVMTDQMDKVKQLVQVSHCLTIFAELQLM